MMSDTRICSTCNEEKAINEFKSTRTGEKYTLPDGRRRTRQGGIRRSCIQCLKNQQRHRYLKYRLHNYFVYKATRTKSKSQSSRFAYDLTPEYLESIWTTHCPVLGIEFDITKDRGDEQVPELDRIIPEKGYIQGNVVFMSRKMNRIKGNVSIDELEKLLKWMKQTLS